MSSRQINRYWNMMSPTDENSVGFDLTSINSFDDNELSLSYPEIVNSGYDGFIRSLKIPYSGKIKSPIFTRKRHLIKRKQLTKE